MLPAPPPTIGFDEIAFHIHWDVLGIVAALGFGYVYALRRLAPSTPRTGPSPAVTRRQVIWFTGGSGAVLRWRGRGRCTTSATRACSCST